MKNLTKKQNELLEAIKAEGNNDLGFYVEIGNYFKQNTIDGLVKKGVISIDDIEYDGSGDTTAFLTLR